MMLLLKGAGRRIGTCWQGSSGSRSLGLSLSSKGESQFLALGESLSHLHPPLAPHLHAYCAPELEGSASVWKVLAWA